MKFVYHQLNLFLNNFDSQLTQAFRSAKEVTQFYKQNTARFCTYLDSNLIWKITAHFWHELYTFAYLLPFVGNKTL